MRTTSLVAYQNIKNSGVLSKRRWQAYDTLFNYGPMTGGELVEQSQIAGLWKRLSELAEMGLAVERGEKICSVTGESAIAWDVTNLVVPRPFSKTKNLTETSKAKAERLEKEVDRLNQIIIQLQDIVTEQDEELEKLRE